MAGKKQKTVGPTVKKKSSAGIIIFISILALLLLGGLGFAAGVYLKFIDLNDFKDVPIVGSYVKQPTTNFEPVENISKPELPGQTSPNVKPQTATADRLTDPAVNNFINKVDNDKSKQPDANQQEESKRIAKLARLYGGMKADEAVNILKQLDDDTVLAIINKMEEDQVAKIMALFDPKQAARLTEKMLASPKKTN